MHDGGGGHFGGGHMGGHVGGHVGGHGVNPAHHHHHGSPDMNPVIPGYLPSDAQRRRNDLAVAGQRYVPMIAFVAFAVILAIVLLVT
jgi:hypothetical protein